MTMNFRERFYGLQQRRRSGNSEGGDARAAPTAAETSSVKRALFGRGNTAENLRFVRRELELHRREAERRWNYDFERDRPKEGRYEWSTGNAATTGATRKVLATKQIEDVSRTPSPPPADDDDDGSAAPPRVPPHEGYARPTAAVTDPPVKPAAESSSCSPSALPSSSSATSATTASSTITSRANQRQSAITAHFRLQKRSRSKVKVQERKSSPSPDFHLRGEDSPAVDEPEAVQANEGGASRASPPSLRPCSPSADATLSK